MAFNWKTFQTRTGTAALFAVVMVAGLTLHAWTYFLLFSIIHFGCWMEYQKLIRKMDPEYGELNVFHKYGVMIAGWCLLLWFSPDQCRIGGFPMHEAGWWIGLAIIFALPLMELLLSKQIRLKHIAYSAFGLVYISLSLGFMMDLFGFPERQFSLVFRDGFAIKAEYVLKNAPNMREFSLFRFPWILPAIIIAIIWINDTMAYIVGSLIGKTPLSKISPKKTWEGTIGGIILAVGVTGWLCGTLFPFAGTGFSLTIPTYTWYLLAGVVAITGTVGDLLESKLKRMAGVKDSGHFMHGHGGFLDRFDSLLLAIPFAWLYLLII